jgi:hypothetical protein
MIRVDRGKEASPGVWQWEVSSLGLSGKSRQPLLDACREIKALGGDPAQLAGTFRQGRETADITCSVGIGAGLTVCDRDRGISFEKFQTYPGHVWELEAAAE